MPLPKCLPLSHPARAALGMLLTLCVTLASGQNVGRPAAQATMSGAAQATWVLRTTMAPSPETSAAVALTPRSIYSQLHWHVHRDGSLRAWDWDRDHAFSKVLQSDGTLAVHETKVRPREGFGAMPHVSATTGTPYLHGGGSTLIVDEVLTDGRLTNRVALKSEVLQPLGWRSSIDQLVFGDHTTGFWIHARDSDSWFRVENGQPVAVEGMTKGSTRDRAPGRYITAAEGAQGSLWVLQDTRIRRVSPQGKSLVDRTVVFKPMQREGSLKQYSMTLHHSHAGVLVVSTERQQMISFDHDGNILWQRSLCADEVSYACELKSLRAGRVTSFRHVTGDAKGDAFVNDGQRLMKMTAQGLERVLREVTTPCGEREQAPCLSSRYHLAQIAQDRLLLATPDDELTTLTAINLRREGSLTAATYGPSPTPFEALKSSEREVVVAAVGGIKRGRASEADGDIWGAQFFGTPTHPVVDGVYYSPERLAEGTKHIPDFARGKDDSLTQFKSGTYSVAAVGKHTILKSSMWSDDRSIWAFDVAKQRFSHRPIVLTYAKAKDDDAPASLQVFNSTNGQAFAYDRDTQQVSVIDDQLKLQPLFRLPDLPSVPHEYAVVTCPSQPCGGQPQMVRSWVKPPWLVSGAVHDTLGRLWVHAGGVFHVIQGRRHSQYAWRDVEVTASSPSTPAILQMFPGLAGDVIVLTTSGIAVVRVDAL